MKRGGDGPPRVRQDEWYGALAQLGERYNGIVEVSGSIPLGSTIHKSFECFNGKLVGEVSPTGFFRVLE